MNRPTPVRAIAIFFTSLFFFILFSAAVHAQGFDGSITARSISGQFIVSASPLYSPLLHRAEFSTNDNLIRLDPAFLAVSAERFKQSFWRQIGLKPDAPWSGKIFLALRPARSLDDPVTIAVGPFLKAWNCRVELPDIVTRIRFGRALSAALLLEFASRSSKDPGLVPEIPAWLADGLGQLVLASDGEKIILSLPDKKVNGLSQSRVDKKEHTVDAFAEARRTLQNYPPLTFDELCWPGDTHVNGTDGGAYLASAQLFTGGLVNLEDGPDKMRDFLSRLPGCLNWQTAFYAAFRDDFKRPLDVEKWWALRVVRFAARDPGPRWTVAVSRERLAGLLSVPVEVRASSNSLPRHTEISLQSAVQNFSASQRGILETKARDLGIAQFRLAPPFASLADGYRNALLDFLGEGRNFAPPPSGKHSPPAARRAADVAATVKKLNALDAQRRAAEAGTGMDSLPQKLNRSAR
jgi:hypothetical protein